MGRSSLQGTPWHYEYLTDKKSKNANSINCVYNTGEHCSCKPCVYYHKACVGKSACEWFERGSGSLAQRNKSNAVKKKPAVSAVKKVNAKKKKVVTIGQTVLIQQIKTKEQIEIKVMDSKNPFVGKTYNDTVKIKGEEYRVLSFSAR